jgi:hypothetical protein
MTSSYDKKLPFCRKISQVQIKEVTLSKLKGMSTVKTEQYTFKLKRSFVMNAPCIQYFEPVWTIIEDPGKIYNLGPYRDFLYSG